MLTGLNLFKIPMRFSYFKIKTILDNEGKRGLCVFLDGLFRK